MENSQNWFRKHLNKIGYTALLVIILILAIGYANLKKDTKVTVNAGTEQVQEQSAINAQPIKIEQEPTVDTVAPRIENFCLSSAFPPLKKFEERVCINIDSWSGYLDSTNSIPITGKIEGDIKSITVDGKKIVWDENKEIYQRISLYVYGGLNKYKVVVEDINGNKATGYVETDAENTDNDLDVNLNE